MNELTVKSEFTLQLDEFEKINETCKKILSTKHYAKLGEDGVHIIMSRAKALGIHPFEALNGGFFVIQGRVGMTTEMMAALARKRGHSITKDPKSNHECVILHGKRADNGDEWTCTFTKQDAEIAGLWNTSTWRKYPAIMLYNRCMSMLFRQLFPDLSLGAGYVEDEIKEITKTGEYKEPENTIVVKPEKVKEVQKPQTEEVIELITQEQVEELISLLHKCPQDYIDHVYDKVLPKNFKVSSLNELQSTNFERVKLAFIQKISENKSLDEESA